MKPLLPVLLLISAACAESPEKPAEGDLPTGVSYRVRGHQEAVIEADGSLTPRWFGTGDEVGLCFDAPLALDTSQWRLRLRFGDLRQDSEFQEPTARAGTTLCFGRHPPPELASSPALEVCATLLDTYEDLRYRVPCFHAFYEADDTHFLSRRRRDVARAQDLFGQSSQDLGAELDRLTAGAEADGFPFLAMLLQTYLYFALNTDGTPEALEDLSLRLEKTPEWLERPEAATLDAIVKHEHVSLEIGRSRLRRAWELLAKAEESARSIAATQRLSIATQQARILARLGAGREPIERLRAVLAECELWPCDELLESSAHGHLAWLLLIEPDASPDELDEAAVSLRGAIATTEDLDPRERINWLINAALLASRQNRDVAPLLAEVRAALATLTVEVRPQNLLAWADVVAGLAGLAAGEPERAVGLCRPPADAPFPRVAAWAWSCLGRAHRRLGEPAKAAQAFEQAIVRHAFTVPEAEQVLPLAPGQRVDDYYRAARLAVERRDPQEAWRILETLDLLSIDARTVCEEESEEHPRQLEARRREILDQLAVTEAPHAPDRLRQMESVRRSLMRELTDLHRAVLADCHGPLEAALPAADLRAFALPDEVVLLERTGGDQVVARRHPIPRLELRRRLERLAKAQQAGRLDDEDWVALTRPLADALAPANPESLGEVTRYALHGLLQRIPVAALPVTNAGGTHWLGELTTVALRPAFVEQAPVAASPSGSPAPLFVVDPRLDLPSGAAARDAYRKHFADARILFGPEATRDAVRSALGAVSFLHVDAHGTYDAAFPELSGLLMHDGSLDLVDFSGLLSPRGFVNLSGCHTGRASETGDSGRYGLAGALARRSVGWVVASRSAIEDRLGHDFNRAFYREIARGSAVPAAFGVAAGALRRSYPAAAWSNLMLVGSDRGSLVTAGQKQLGRD